MKKFIAISLAVLMIFALAACGCQAEKKTKDEPTATSENVENTSFPEGDPAEYSREYWEAKYPGENICPFYIVENGKEYSYYWVSGFEGWSGTFDSWLSQPFNWNGWHKTDDGCIVNKDETLKITDDWANGDESMSSYCSVTTEKYEKNNSGEVDQDWPFKNYKKPENCTIENFEDWDAFAKIYVKWDNKDAAKAYKEALGLNGGTTADMEGAYEYNSSKVMISYSETNALANFIMIYN